MQPGKTSSSMEGLTIFTIPKPFRGHIATIQRNAIRSWVRLRPACDVILFGDDDGVGEIAAEFNVTHMPGIPCNEYGTPLVSAAFERTEELSSKPFLCYVNADIILLPDLLGAVRRIGLTSFLALGRRWDLEVAGELDLQTEDFEEHMRTLARTEGSLHPPMGSDYFVFPKGSIGQLPPFAVGRPGWDNWLIHRARQLQIPVVDMSRVVTVIHQNHDYRHVPGRTGSDWEGPEAEINRSLAGGWRNAATIYDATKVLTHKGMRRPSSFGYLAWHAKRHVFTVPAIGPVARAVRYLARKVGASLRTRDAVGTRE